MNGKTVLTVLAMACGAMSCGDAPEYLAPRNLGFEAPFMEVLILCDPPKTYEECMAENIEVTHEKLAYMFEHADFIAYVDMDYDYTDMLPHMSITNFRKFEITEILKNNLSLAGIDEFLLEGGYDEVGLGASEVAMESVYSGLNLVFGIPRCIDDEATDKISVMIYAAYPIEGGLIYDWIGRSSELAPLLKDIIWGENQIPANEICVPKT